MGLGPMILVDQQHLLCLFEVARLEAAETIDALLDRFGTLELGQGGHVYSANPTFRGFSQLFVEGAR